MDKQMQAVGVDRETRRWIFDTVAWVVGVVIAATLVAEAAAGPRAAESPVAMPASAVSACHGGGRGDADRHDARSPDGR